MHKIVKMSSLIASLEISIFLLGHDEIILCLANVR